VKNQWSFPVPSFTNNSTMNRAMRFDAIGETDISEANDVNNYLSKDALLEMLNNDQPNTEKQIRQESVTSKHIKQSPSLASKAFIQPTVSLDRNRQMTKLQDASTVIETTYNPVKLGKLKSPTQSLSLAIQANDSKQALKLVNSGKCEVEARSGFEGSTPLLLASKHGMKDVCEALIKRGADLESADKFGVRALHNAAKSGNAHIAQLLLSHGASVNATDFKCNTAMHLASFQGQTQTVKILRAAGGSTSDVDEFGRTPLECAL
jgi:ankyrin repeat protein